MKILWLSHLLPYPPKAGVLLRAYNLLKETGKAHQVHLVAFNQEDLMRNYYDNVDEGTDEAVKELKSICVDVNVFPIPSGQFPLGQYLLALRSLIGNGCFTTNWLLSSAFRNHLKVLAETTNFDIVHFDTISLAPYLSIFEGIPTVLDHHNVESHMMHRRSNKEKNIAKRLYFRREARKLELFEKSVVSNFNLNITCSGPDSERLREISPDANVTEIENGVDTEYFHASRQPAITKSIIFVGTMNWYPNIDAVQYLIELIFPLVLAKYPDTMLHIIGANPPQKIHKLAQTHSQINLHGFVDDIRPYLEKATVYVCPIRDGGGTKLKILDALAMQIPIVCQPLACEGIDVIDGEHIFFANNPEQFCKYISDLFSNPTIGHNMGLAGRRLVETTYSFTDIGRKLVRAYEQLQSTNESTD